MQPLPRGLPSLCEGSFAGRLQDELRHLHEALPEKMMWRFNTGMNTIRRMLGTWHDLLSFDRTNQLVGRATTRRGGRICEVSFLDLWRLRLAQYQYTCLRHAVRLQPEVRSDEPSRRGGSESSIG